METKQQTETLLVNRQCREQYISRIDVLEKVKHLMLIPEMECMTIRQVADYYEVDYETLKKCYERNQDEIDLDGVKSKIPIDFKEFLNVTRCPFKNLEQKNGKLIVQVDNNTTLEIPNRGIRMFPKRAILRMGMLLRDSVIAKEVRTQLLNITEAVTKVAPAVLTQSINEEEELLNHIGRAYATGNSLDILNATMALDQYRQRHIARLAEENTKLTNDKKLLVSEILDLSDRKTINRVMRILATKLKIGFGEAWGNFVQAVKLSVRNKSQGKRQ